MQDILHKTLIIRFSSVGDIVLSSPLLRALRRRFPQSQIDYLVKAEFAELVRQSPYCSHVITFPAGGTFADLLRIRKMNTRERYDAIVDLHGSLRSRFLCLGARRVMRINKRAVARFFLIHGKRNIYRLFGGAPGIAERYMETVARLGVHADTGGLDLFVSEESGAHAAELLGLAGIAPSAPLLGVCPSAKHGNKMWLKDRFAEAAIVVARERGASVVLLGSPDDAAQCDEVRGMIHAFDPSLPVADLAGRTSLAEAAAVMDRCFLVLSNDSGLMHIAAARTRPVVAIFGPTVREFGFFPEGARSVVVEPPPLPCRPCTHIGLPECPEGHFRCMNEIPAARVIAASRQIFAS